MYWEQFIYWEQKKSEYQLALKTFFHSFLLIWINSISFVQNLSKNPDLIFIMVSHSISTSPNWSGLPVLREVLYLWHQTEMISLNWLRWIFINMSFCTIFPRHFHLLVLVLDLVSIGACSHLSKSIVVGLPALWVCNIRFFRSEMIGNVEVPVSVRVVNEQIEILDNPLNLKSKTST